MGVVLVAVALINVASSSSHSVAADTDTLQLVQVVCVVDLRLVCIIGRSMSCPFPL